MKRFHISWSPMYRYWRIFDREDLSVTWGKSPSLALAAGLELSEKNRARRS